jgi:hypothetical protein
MKKNAIVLAIIGMMLIAFSHGYAAEGVTGSVVAETENLMTGEVGIIVRLEIECDANGRLNNQFIPANVWTEIDGKWLYEVRAYSGSPAVTNESNLQITENGFDILGGAGAANLSATAITSIIPIADDVPAERLLLRRPKIVIIGNSVAGAKLAIELIVH